MASYTPPRYALAAGCILLEVHAIPGASREEVGGVRAGRLVVRVTAPPEAGKANDAVTRALAAALGVRRSALRLAGGAASRRKTFAIEGLDEAALLAALARLGDDRS